MANQIQISGGLTVSGAGVSIASSFSASATQSNTNLLEETVALSTTTSAIPVGSIVSMGYLCVKNLDATNTVRIGLATPVTSGNAFSELKPGEGFTLPTRQTVIYGIAVAGTPEILIAAAEL